MGMERMEMASAAGVEPFIAVAHRLQGTLAVRSDTLLTWTRTGEAHLADVPEGKLLLTPRAEFWTLTAIFEADAEGPDATPQRIERGRRTLAVGSPARLQRLALDLAVGGVAGGPAFTGDPAWTSVDGSRRLVLPEGELRISGPRCGTSTLIYDNGLGVELLSKGTWADLERQGLTWWEKRRKRRLKVVVKRRHWALRSIDVAGVIGYCAVADNRVVALVLAGDELALLDIQGLYPYVLARVSWEEALLGEAFDVDRLIEERRGAANHSPAANNRPGPPPPVEVPGPTYETAPAASSGPRVAGTGLHMSCPAGHTPMFEPHRALCHRYLRRLHRRLRGRGARKARELVLLLLEALEWCRADIMGTRVEVHAELERMLGRPLSGGNRNIRDCLDLLIEHSLLGEWTAGEDEGRRCTLLLGQLHDPDSALMRRIAEEEAAEETAAIAKAAAAGPLTAASTPQSAGAAVLADPDRDEPSTVEPEPILARGAAPAAGSPDAALPSPDVLADPEPVASVATADDPRTNRAVWEALARREQASCAGTPPQASTLLTSNDLIDPGQLPLDFNAEVSLRGFVRRRASGRGDLIDLEIELPGSPSHLMWDDREKRRPPHHGDDDQEPP